MRQQEALAGRDAEHLHWAADTLKAVQRVSSEQQSHRRSRLVFVSSRCNLDFASECDDVIESGVCKRLLQ